MACAVRRLSFHLAPDVGTTRVLIDMFERSLSHRGCGVSPRRFAVDNPAHILTSICDGGECGRAGRSPGDTMHIQVVAGGAPS